MQTVEKWATRSDAWTPDDDERLAALVLYHIKTGSTQLRAFEEAANHLGRTAAACGYRWNGVVRKNFRAEIEQAKQERKEFQRSAPTGESSHLEQAQVKSITTSESMKEIIQFLQNYDEQYHKLLSHLHTLEADKQSLQNQLRELEHRMTNHSETTDEPLTPEQLEEDSKVLFAIMERARKILGEGVKTKSEF